MPHKPPFRFKLWLRRLLANIRTPIIRYFYQRLASQTGDIDLAFMNYGYACLEDEALLSLETQDEKYRYPIQLYNASFNGFEVRGKDILEVGCGRGGGASFVKRYHHPRSMLGVDFSEKAVALASRDFAEAGLSFQVGNAESLSLEADRFDAVMNVESSHCYGDLNKFFSEVYRVLKPGGLFFYTDFRLKRTLDQLEHLIQVSGFDLLTRKEITSNVVEGLEKDTPRRMAIIDSQCKTEGQKKRYADFAAVKGSPIYNSFANGRREYFSIVFQKPDSLG